MIIYFVGLIVLASVLMTRNPLFFIFAITGFFHAAVLRPFAADDRRCRGDVDPRSIR